MIKRNKITAVIFTLIITTCVFGAPIGSGDINFKGYIEPGLYFTVAELNPQVYNLIDNADLQPGGVGVEVGTWTLRVDNPPVTDTLYDVTYTYSALGAEEIEDIIGFSLLEKTSDRITVVEKLSSDSTRVTISSTPGLNIVTRILSARLTVEGATAALIAAASEKYESNITVALSTE